MTSADWMSFGYLGTLALLAGVLATISFAAFLHFEKHRGHWFGLMVIPTVAFGMVVSAVLSGRDLKYAAFNIGALAAEPGGGGGVLRLLTGMLMGLAGAAVVGRWFKASQVGRPAVVLPGTLLWVAFLLFYVSNNILNAFLGTVPAFTHNSIYVAVLFTAVFVRRGDSLSGFITAAKWSLLGVMLLSLLAAAVKPSLAVQPAYSATWIPGMNIRLWGVGSNPNSLGPLALLLGLLEVLQPTQRRPLRWLVWVSGAFVFVLAQSKTAWGGALLATAILVWYRWARLPGGGGIRIGFVLAVIFGTVFLLSAVLLVDADRVMNRIFAGQVGADVTTLTGRAAVWAAALDAWRTNPLFGYGPLAWGAAHRFEIGLPFAFTAHNQFFQSLSAAGALGLLSLLGYFGLLILAAWRAAGPTRGVSLALMMAIILRSVTEAPFGVGTLFNGDTLTQLVLFRLLMIVPARSIAPTFAARLKVKYANSAGR